MLIEVTFFTQEQEQEQSGWRRFSHAATLVPRRSPPLLCSSTRPRKRITSAGDVPVSIPASSGIASALAAASEQVPFSAISREFATVSTSFYIDTAIASIPARRNLAPGVAATFAIREQRARHDNTFSSP
ncbi:hypothetical protein E2562_012531 [Oryza meyeriana var. granulata]|uniref:Uncharacterized protein n=1 Tax=Oryza meyeriana var. granulata TaxID=110450 RepID=A0A6G1D1E2_9ORYZ|nr:hypothetical protein E2562_012531 [Oryza meyeriana var. granulata]